MAELPLGETSQRLDEFTKDEWKLVMRSAVPDMTDEEFDDAWKAFAAMKMARSDCQGSA